MNLEEDIKTTPKKAGNCYGCMHLPEEGEIKCEDGKIIKNMQKQKCFSYEEYPSVLTIYNIRQS